MGPRRFSRLDTEERRSAILDAARQLFSEQPYGEVSTTRIAEAAGVTRGLVHHYFGAKRALYLEVVRDIVASPLAPLLDAMRGPAAGGPPLAWEQGVDGWMQVVEHDAAGWLLAISAGETGQDQAMRDILHAAREEVATRVLEVLGLDERAVPEARALVRAFGAFAEHITVEWLDRGRLTRAQARVLLLETLPLLVTDLLPKLTPTAAPSGRGGARRRGAR